MSNKAHLPYAIPDDTMVDVVECFDGCGKPSENYEVDDGNPRCDECAERREKLVERNRREASRESALEHRAVMRMEGR